MLLVSRGGRLHREKFVKGFAEFVGDQKAYRSRFRGIKDVGGECRESTKPTAIVAIDTVEGE